MLKEKKKSIKIIYKRISFKQNFINSIRSVLKYNKRIKYIYFTNKLSIINSNNY